MGMRRAGEISIVDWTATVESSSLTGEIKTLLKGQGARGILVNMSECGGVRADSLEALTEAFAACRDHQCRIGLFGVRDGVARLIEILGLEQDLPPVLGTGEQEALATIQGNGSGAAHAAPQQPTPEPIIDIELDFETAPTAKFSSASVMAAEATAAPAGPPAEQPDEDLLAVFWADLAAQGYAIGGEDADRILAAVARDGQQTAATPPTPAEEEGVIDLGDMVPARRPYQTEVLPAFRLDEDSGGSGWSASPSGEVEVEFATDASSLTSTPVGVFGRQEEPSEFSPVDVPGGGPPAGVLSAQSAPAPAAPAEPTWAEPQPAMAAAAPPPVTPADGAGVEDADETVMFQPGALDAALLQASAEAIPSAPPEDLPAPPVPQPREAIGLVAPSAAAEPAPPVADEQADQDSTVMFQPGALDAALLAEVAQAAGPETPIQAPPLEPPPTEAPAQPPPAELDPQEVEVRAFFDDLGVASALHVQVLERFTQVEDEVLGPSVLQNASGGSRGAILEILDQLVQARLVRRTRSPRVRGGSGFVFSPSPKVNQVVKRTITLWRSPDGRAKILSWLREG